MRAAGLDVYEYEGELFFYDRSGSPIQDSTLLRMQSLPNVIITGHQVATPNAQAFFTNEAVVAIAETTVSNIRLFGEGKQGTTHPNSVYQAPKL